MGSSVPSRVNPLVLHIKAESGASRAALFAPPFRDSVNLLRQPPSGRFRVCQVTHLRTDSDHFRESAGTGPAVLQVARVTDAASIIYPMYQINARPSYPTPTSDTGTGTGIVGMCGIEAADRD